MLISARCNVGEVAVHAELHQGSKPIKCVQGDAWCRLDCDLQLVLVGMKDDIALPLFAHVAGISQRKKLRDQWFEGFYIRESGAFW
jgi:hypothetical protein